MRKRLLSLLFTTICCAIHAEIIVLDDAVGYDLDETTMTASLYKSTYPYGQMEGYFRDYENIRDTIFYQDKKYPVTSIGEMAFYPQQKLKRVTIPYGIKVIGKQAFAMCSSLEEVNLPNSIDSIGPGAFTMCSSITSITIPSGLRVGGSVLAGCSNLNNASIDIDIYDNFFQNCKKLSSVNIGNHCTSIGRDAFNGCSALLEIFLPSSVTKIGIQAFMASGLTSISIPEHIKTIEESTFWGCTNLTSVSLGVGVTRIEQSAFYNCTALPEITIPEQVEYIGTNAFLGCSSLKSVIWNAKNCAIYDVTSQRPFSKIETNITSFVFGSNVQQIPDNLCNGMQNLEEVTAYMKNPPQISESVFQNCGNLKDIVCYVPAESINKYRNADVWKEFKLVAIGQQVATEYTVSFKDWDGTVLKTEQVEEGHSATAPTNPTREGYTFIGWDKSFNNVQSDLIVTAQYAKNESQSETITVSLKSSWANVYLWAWTAEGNVFAAWPGQKLSKDVNGWYKYTFDKSISNVSIIWNDGSGNQTVDISDVIQSTCYQLNSTTGTKITVKVVDCPTQTAYYTVTFKDWDGTVLKTEQVEEGHSATAPTNPTREGYTFIGWDKSFNSVQSDLIVTAQYAKNETQSETITVSLKSSWSNVYLWAWTADGNVFAAWPGQKLSKDVNGWHKYTFDKSISNVSIIWNDGSGNQTVDISDVTQSTCYQLNSTTGTKITVYVVDCNRMEAINEIYIEEHSSHKVFLNGQIFILRDGKVYTLTGMQVK